MTTTRTAPDLLTAARAARTARDAADVRLLVLAVQWAERHTIDPTTGHPVTKSFLEDVPGEHGTDAEDHEWLGLPTLRWDTAASFAAALAMSTASGKAFIRDALVLAVRMPKVWARVLAGDVAGMARPAHRPGRPGRTRRRHHPRRHHHRAHRRTDRPRAPRAGPGRGDAASAPRGT